MKKADLIVIGIVFAVAILFSLVFAMGQGDDGSINVYVDNELYTTMPFYVESTLVLDQEGGHRNVIVITDEGVFMKSSTCKNQVCVDQGMILYEDHGSFIGANWIICLPNKVSVELAGGK